MIPRDEFGDPIRNGEVCGEWEATDADRRSVRSSRRIRMTPATSSAAQAQESWVERWRREGDQ